MGYIKKLKSNELVGGTDKTTIYPVTSTEAVFEEVAEGDKSSFQSQKSINTDRLERIETLEAHDENHEGRVSTLEEHDSDHESRVQELESVVPDTIRSISINGGTEHTVDESGNVDLTIYTVNPDDPDVPAMVDLVEKNRDDIADIKEEIGTDTTQNTLSGRITELETLVGGNEQGSVNQRIEDAVNALDVPTATVIDDTGHVSITLGETNGKIDSLAVSTNDIASAEALDTLDVYVHAIEGGNIRVKSSTPTNPDTGAPTNTVYRVAGTTTYSDYMWNGTTMVKMAEYNVDTLESQFGYYKWETASNTISITTNNQVTGSPIGSYNLTTGGSFKIKMSNKATGACTLNMNNKGAKTLLYNGVAVSADNTWEKDEVISVYFDGTNYQASNSQGGGNLSIIHEIDTTAEYEEKDIAGADAVNKMIADYNIIHRKENFTGWAQGNYNTGTTAVPLDAGVTYELVWDNTAQVAFRWWDESNNQYTPINLLNVTGPYVYKFTPDENVVKLNYYSNAANTFTIRVKNTNKIVLLKTDVVNNLKDGGTNVPLSAEQGKVLSNDVGTLNTCYVPLCRRTLSLSNRGFVAPSFTNASAIFKNTGFKKLSVKDGYKYILSSQNYGYYKSNDALHSIIGTYTTNDWVNTSSDDWFWINIQRVDGESIPKNELYEILSIEDSSSADAFKNINAVDDVYKIGKKYNVTFDIIQGEGISDQGGITTSTQYTRTDYVDVRDIFALILPISTTFDTETHVPKISIIWYDENKEKISTSFHTIKRGDTQCVIAVPGFATYMSLFVTGGTPNNAIAIKKENNLIDALYDDASTSPIGHLKKVSFILVYGQSLGNGSDSVGISNSRLYYPLKMLNGYNPSSLGNKAFQSLVCPASGFEYPDRGCGEMFIEAIAKENNLSAYSNEWENHLIVFANCAAGSKTIAELSTDLYTNVETAITNVKNLCDEFGYTMDAPAWVWNQGEQDIKTQMSSADYKTALLALQDKYCNSLQTIAGITKRPKCVIYQPACQCLYSQTYDFANPYLEFLNAYVELLKDNNEFIASAPVYIFDVSDSGGRFVHLNARSYKMLGAYAGYAIKKAVIDKVNMKGVIPLTITVSGTTITIKYNVPCPPLKFDTEWVKETPLVNGVHTYGFNVVKSDDTELISSVSVFDDTVTIECTESPIGAKLRYGLNGDRIKIVASEYWGVDGRIYGGRGNLRDSQGDYVQKEIRELRQTIRLDNWAYCFEQILS